jgi:hypothetical protein
MNDRRSEPRHELVLPIQVSGFAATTRDVSSGGVYFFSNAYFEPGGEIEFKLPLPKLADLSVEFSCKATVVRVDAAYAAFGVAARIDRFSLTPLPIREPFSH